MTSPVNEANLEAIVSAVSESRKYRAICPDTIRRIARRELSSHPAGPGRGGDVKVAAKETKRKLHQVYGAFEQGFDYEDAYAQLAAAYTARSDARIRATCRDLLGRHSSTRERLPVLDEFYPPIFAVTGRPTSLLDLGCGLNPLTIPWMGLPPDAHYHAFDIDAARIDFLNRYLTLAGFQPLAHWQDIICQPPDAGAPADVALLLKTSPCLDRQEPEGSLRVLESLRTRFAVVSFAVKSLGGREKGMLTHYQEQFLALAEGQGWLVTRLVFATELVFVVRKQARS